MAIDECYMRDAEAVARQSKDESRKIGAVVVKDGCVVTVGYNCFPRGVKDMPSRRKRPAKYRFTVHAEQNAVFYAAREGISLFGGTIYITGWLPCEECAKAIIQAGIVKVVTQQMCAMPGWEEKTAIGMEMLEEAGIPVRLADEIPLD